MSDAAETPQPGARSRITLWRSKDDVVSWQVAIYVGDADDDIDHALAQALAADDFLRDQFPGGRGVE